MNETTTELDFPRITPKHLTIVEILIDKIVSVLESDLKETKNYGISQDEWNNKINEVLTIKLGNIDLDVKLSTKR